MSLKSIIVVLVAFYFCSITSLAWSRQEADPRAQTNTVKAGENKKTSRGGLPDDVPGLQQAAVEAYQQENYQRFTQATMLLRKQRPFEPQYMIGMVAGAARLGRQTTAYNYMHIMQQQGLSYDFNSTPDTESIRATEVYDYLNDLLIRAGRPAGAGHVAFTLNEAASYPEAIAWDASRERLLLGTIDQGAILAVTPDGKVEELLRANAENGLWAVHGIAVDAGNDRLWVTSTGVPGFQGLQPTDLGRSALFEFKLSSLEVVNRYFVPTDGHPHLLGSLGLTPAGDVYLIDRAVPLIFRKAAASTKLEPYLGNAQMVGFRDMALSQDGAKLYVADAALGVLVVDLASQSLVMLAGPETLNLGGISGLWYDDGSLLMLQNGIDPHRLMRLELDAGGAVVSHVSPIAVALEPFDFPAFGAVAQGSVFYFAGSNIPGAHEGRVKPLVMRSPVVLPEGIPSVEGIKFREENIDKAETDQQ